MWKLATPQHTAQETFTTCISRIRNRDLRGRLEDIVDDVVEASEGFMHAVGSLELHALPATNNVRGIVRGPEIANVYTQRMARVGAPGREIYDEILSAPEFGRCPLCGHRMVSTLDHHLPKARYPILSVTPLNLIPCCADCNKAKIDLAPRRSEDETLHPYFDDIEDDRWLRAAVLEAEPAAVRFYVDPPDQWDQILTARVRRHFTIFGLSRLYASQAAQEVVNIRHNLRAVFARGRAREVRAHLEERAISAEVARTNSWQTAAYESFALSDWFCEGGFASEG